MNARDLIEGYPLALGKDAQAFASDVDWKGIITWTTPQKFLSLVRDLPDEVLSHPDTQEKIDRLAAKMEKGEPIDPFVLITDHGRVISHEGRHRARACIKKGINKVPVLVVPRDYPRYTAHYGSGPTQWSPEQLAKVKQLDFMPESRGAALTPPA